MNEQRGAYFFSLLQTCHAVDLMLLAFSPPLDYPERAANSLILNNKQIGESLLCENDGSTLIYFTKEVYTLETCIDKFNEGVYI